MSRPLPSWLRRLDDGIYRVERAVVVACLSVMVITVFFDVMNRRVEAEESKMAAFLLFFLRHLGVPSAGGGPSWLRNVVAPAASALVAFGLVWFALATMRGRKASRLPARLEPAIALAGTGVLYLFVWVMEHRTANEFYALVWVAIGIAIGFRLLREGGLRLVAAALATPIGAAALYHYVPSDYAWAKEVAMILLVWTGFVGASMATHDGRHIDIDFGKKMFPAALRRPAAILAQVVHLGFALLLLVLGAIYVFEPEVGLFELGGRFPYTGIPDWIVGAAIPACFAVLSVRVGIVVLKLAGGDDAAKGSGVDASGGGGGHGPSLSGASGDDARGAA